MAMLLLPAGVRAQTDSLAVIRRAPKTIDALLRRHLFDPRLLDLPELKLLATTADSLGQDATSSRMFVNGFNRLWRSGPVSHVRLASARMSAPAMMAFVDTMRVGSDALTLRWDGRIAILTVRTMNGVDTREGITRYLRDVIREHAAGLVIDLRENDGGAFAVVPLVGHLLDRPVEGGTFIGQRWYRAHGTPPSAEEQRSLVPWTGWSLTRFWSDVEQRGALRIVFQPVAPHFDGPVIVLTSRATASAAELAVDAMLASGRVDVFGERTAGQMLSQRPFDVLPGLQLYVPIADYQSTRMGRIEGVGVTPTVAMPAAQALDSALAHLRRR
jgi:hypothetical protein